MKNKLFSFVLSFTVIAVAAATVDCGCVFAETFSSARQVNEQSAMGHCEQDEKTPKEAEQCCAGCQLQLGVLNSQQTHFQLERSKEIFLPSSLLLKDTLHRINKYLLNSAWSHGFDKCAVSVPGSNQPLYIAFESLLI